MTTLIGLNGRKRSGKDTAAQALICDGFEPTAFADPLKAALELFDPCLDTSRPTYREEAAAYGTGSHGDQLRHALSLALIHTGDAVLPSSGEPYVRMLEIFNPHLLGPTLASAVRQHGWEGIKADSFPHHREVRRLMQQLGTEAARGVLGDDLWVNEAMAQIRATRSTGRRVVVTDVRSDREAAALIDEGGLIFEIVRPSLGPRTDTHSSESGISEHLITETILNDSSIEALHDRIRGASYADV